MLTGFTLSSLGDCTEGDGLSCATLIPAGKWLKGAKFLRFGRGGTRTGSAATRAALSASDDIARILRPGGELLGSPGIRPGIRTLPSRQELDDLFEQLSARGVPTSSKYPGTGFDLPEGGFVGLRESARYGPTIDINIPGFDVFKYHLGG